MCWLAQGRWGTDSSCSTSAWAAPSVHSERWMQYPRRRPIASSIMGFEDEVEQSLARPCRRDNGRFKRTYELTSSIVPRGTSLHRWVDLRFPPILFDTVQLSRRGDLPRPPEVSTVNPDAMHDHRQPTRKRHDGLFHAAVPGDFHRPRLEPGPFRRTHQHALGRFVEHHSHHLVSAP